MRTTKARLTKNVLLIWRILGLWAKEINGGLLGEIHLLMPVLRIPAGSRQFIFDFVQARLGQVHGIKNVLPQGIVLLIRAADGARGRLHGGGGNGERHWYNKQGAEGC